jgi:hypothetical protein
MKTQQQIIRLYLEYRDSPPGLVQLVRRNLGHYLLRILIAALAIMLAYMLQRPELAFLVLGMLVGALLRDLAFFNRLARTWPTTASVLDWDRIEALLEDRPGEAHR